MITTMDSLRFSVKMWIFSVLLLGCFGTGATQSGHIYWNDKYSSYTGFISYTTDDSNYGMFNLLGDTYHPSGRLQLCGGCACSTTDPTPCSGSTINIAYRDIIEFDGDNFPYEDLTTMSVAHTKLQKLPPLFNATSLSRLLIYNSQLKMDNDQQFPASLTHLALVNGELTTTLKNWFSLNTNLRTLSLAYNRLSSFPIDAFTSTHQLLYLGLEGNNFKSFSVSDINKVNFTQLQHLNLSNNALEFIQPDLFSKLPALRILELHNNKLSNIPVDTLSNIPSLLHLDLNNNYLKTVTSGAFWNLPQLVTLRLHSQQQSGGLESIHHSAFKGMGSLKFLFISDNNFVNFPHSSLASENYTDLEIIYADNNNLASLEKLDEEAFTVYNTAVLQIRRQSHVPFNTMPNVKTLFLYNNLLPYLNKTVFCGMPVLEDIHLDSNLLTEATIEDSFDCLGVLERLDLSLNDIQYITRVLSDNNSLPNITTLELRDNKITFIQTGAFSKLSTLKYLYLSSNKILTAENESFPDSIEVIDLTNNEFEFLHTSPFSYLDNLDFLDLGDNRISSLPLNAFSNCTSLRTIYLNNNNIGWVYKKHFENCTSLTYINLINNYMGIMEDGSLDLGSFSSILLSNNMLQEIPLGGTFSDISRPYIDLNNNRIKSVPSGSFVDMDASSILLTGNRITRVETGAFLRASMLTLDLTLNPIKDIATNAFHHSSFSYIHSSGIGIENLNVSAFNDTQISYLYLSGNNLPTLKEGVFNNVNIGEIDLSSSKIREFAGPLFSRGPSNSPSTVTKLDLRNNEITYIADDIFDGVQIQEIFLDNNPLSNYPAAALVGQGSSIISLSGNHIEDIPLGSFTGYSFLETLDLSNNRLVTLPDALFEPLTSLQNLYLQDNELTTADLEALTDLTTLQNVDLSNNNFTFIPAFTATPNLKTVNIANNKISTLAYNAFAGVNPTVFENVNLIGNPLSCDCYLYYSLSYVSQSITGGSCNLPPDAVGITFDSSTRGSSSHFLQSSHLQKFRCSATNVRATALGTYKILVEWEAPTEPYPGGALDPNAEWTYIVTCEGLSPGNPTLHDNQTDDLPVKVTQQALTFLQSHGVLQGNEYMCYIALSIDGGAPSGQSPPAYVTTPTDVIPTVPTPIGNDDYSLDVALYDFSRIHKDFTGVSTAVFTRPDIVPSPYGAWLVRSDLDTEDPTEDSFSDWFRVSATVNQVFRNVVLVSLGNLVNTPTNRFFSAEYYPLDGLGYGHEQQKDCEGNLHNFGFTAAIRAGFTFQGVGNLSIGGGDEVWVYVDRKLVLEVKTNPTDPHVPCKLVSLDGAEGGTMITPLEGIVVNGSCIATTPLPEEQVELTLNIGDTYHLDIFIVERYGCKSRLFLETQSLSWLQPERGDPPPSDYLVSVNEDLHEAGIVAELTVTDPFITGPSFDVTMLQGNKARHFSLTSDTVEARAAAIPPPPPVYNYTYLKGTNVYFLECDETATQDPDTALQYDNSTEDFILIGAKVLLVINSTLDYERENHYLLIMTTIDTDRNSFLTGTIVVRIKVEDVNDNCPVTATKSFHFKPQPALKTDPIIYLRATDIDSGINAEINYHVSTHDVYPPLSRYSISDLFSLYDTIYHEMSTVTFTLAAVDLGTPPRGVSVNVSVTVKNSCLLSVLLEELEVRIVVNATSGDTFFRLPKYYVQTYECDREGGLEAGFFLDSHITASSELDFYAPAKRARLNITRETLYGGWVAGTFDTNQWIQLNMTTQYRFKKLYTQGREDAAMWVTSFRLSYSDDGSSFTQYVTADGVTLLPGNDDQNTVSVSVLDPPISAVYLRVEPVTWSGGISMRLEVRGCTSWEYEYYLTSCQRCETTWYCPGDGSRSPCGRCEPVEQNSTCGRTPSEHSFGAAEHCSPCPAGWICNNGYATPCGRYEYSDCNATFCPDTCSPCGPGHACFNGIRTECRPGTYSTGFQAHCLTCDIGTYQSLPGQTACINCQAGYYSSKMKSHCSPCEFGYWSDGSVDDCQLCVDAVRCPCMARPGPCPLDVECNNVDGSGTFTCGPCPHGYSGDGYTCTDINECFINDPCFQSRCINTQPGYQCLECPPGYQGTYEDALAWNVIRRTFRYKNLERSDKNYQECTDMDECILGTTRCSANQYCINQQGSYQCGHCFDGYINISPIGCVLSDYCLSGQHTCHEDAKCITTGPTSYRCECPVGFAGDGSVCGEDDDLDGIPSLSINCGGKYCKRDNCPLYPNSGQENLGLDRDGNACDTDDDSDGVFNFKDNCRFHDNYHQEDADSDGVGDVCDNCPNDVNSRQVDTDSDGIGDACDLDDDGDGLLDQGDNCPLVSNPSQIDSDNDGIGDGCDNCLTVSNSDQTDINQDGYGDACVTPGTNNIDRDGDGAPLIFDNCQQTPNSDQSDVDSDGTGDVCDEDIDGDGLANELDNCMYVANAGQEDDDNNGIGNVCEQDVDGDGVIDSLDPCPKIPAISSYSFTSYQSVNLFNATSPDDQWIFTDGGREVTFTAYSNDPQMLISSHAVGSMEFSGTLYVDDDTSGDNYIGFVFGYHSNRRFYVVQWSRNNSNLEESSTGALRGLSLKLVDSTTGPGPELRNALWYSSDTTHQASLLWQDPDMLQWKPFTSYRWTLNHRPQTGSIRLRLWTSKSLFADTGNINNTALAGGKLGLFLQGARRVIWSNLNFRCIENEDYALSFDGVDDHVTLKTFTEYDLSDSFTIGLWINPRNITTNMQPVLCTQNPTLCIYLQDGVISGIYGATVVGNKTLLPLASWSHIGLRYEAQYFTLTLFINGTVDDITYNVLPLVWDSTLEEQTIHLGRNGTDFFTGLIDELRLYRMWLTDDEVLIHLVETQLTRPAKKNYLSATYTMDDITNSNQETQLTDGGPHDRHGVLHGGLTYVQSNQHLARYRLAHPTN